MEEFEKWLEEDAWFNDNYSALDKYRSMTCKMESIPGGKHCSNCHKDWWNEYNGPEVYDYCPNCGRKVQNNG